MNKNSGNNVQNQYNVPSQQWGNWSGDSQGYYNDLFKQLQSKRQQFINQLPPQSDQNITKNFDSFITDTCIAATQLYNERQLQSHDE